MRDVPKHQNSIVHAKVNALAHSVTHLHRYAGALEERGLGSSGGSSQKYAAWQQLLSCLNICLTKGMLLWKAKGPKDQEGTKGPGDETSVTGDRGHFADAQLGV